MEMQLARICMLIDAQRRPGETLHLKDYLFDFSAQDAPDDAAPPTEAQADAACEALNFKPRPTRRRPEAEHP